MYLPPDQAENERILAQIKKEDLGMIVRNQAKVGRQYILYSPDASGDANKPEFVETDTVVFAAGIEMLVSYRSNNSEDVNNRKELAKIILEQARRIKEKYDNDMQVLIKNFLNLNPSNQVMDIVEENLSLSTDIYKRLRDAQVAARRVETEEHTAKTLQGSAPQGLLNASNEDNSQTTQLVQDYQRAQVASSSQSAQPSQGSHQTQFNQPSNTVRGTIGQVGSSMWTNTWEVTRNRAPPQGIVGMSTEIPNRIGPRGNIDQRILMNGSYPAVDRLPMFKGENRDEVEEWFIKAENIAEICGIPSNYFLKIILDKLTGNAFHIACRMLKEGNGVVEWIRFRSAFFKMCSQSDNQYDLKKQLRELSLDKCEGNFDNFLYKFQGIANRLVGVDEDQLIFEFLEGLPLELRADIIARNANKRLEECMTVARHLSALLPNRREMNESNFAYTKQYQGKSNLEAKKLNNENSPNEKRDEEPKVRCLNCKQMGHIAKHCPAEKANLAKEEERDDDEDELAEGYYDYSVNMVRVISMTAACHEIMTILAYVNGIKLKCAVDSGATTSIMGWRTANKYGFTIFPSQVRIKSQDNKIERVKGIIKEARIEVEGRIGTIDLLVTNHEDYDVLLGLNWLVEMGAMLIPREKRIAFPDDNHPGALMFKYPMEMEVLETGVLQDEDETPTDKQ